MVSFVTSAAVLLAATTVVAAGLSSGAPAPGARPSGPVAGFYSAGLRESRCYGSCTPDSDGAAAEAFDRARMTELQALHVGYVVNNETVVSWYRAAPAAFLAYLDDIHAHGLRVSYSVASGRNAWFAKGRFGTTRANALFARTDLDRDGVSDLDGRLDVLYQGHEVLEWTTHAQRVAIYQVAKKWFPHTPVSVYYAGFGRPLDPRYAYGPGEADIVHLGIRRNASSDGWDAAAFRDEVAREVAIVRQVTPGTPVYVSTNIAGDDQLRRTPAAMWTPDQIAQWWTAATSVAGVSGVLLRSYGRFTYDLANPAFGAQRAAWTAVAGAR